MQEVAENMEAATTKNTETYRKYRFCREHRNVKRTQKHVKNTGTGREPRNLPKTQKKTAENTNTCRAQTSRHGTQQQEHRHWQILLC